MIIPLLQTNNCNLTRLNNLPVFTNRGMQVLEEPQWIFSQY